MDLSRFTAQDKTVLILSSIPLDWDSLASGLILKKYLQSLHKQVTLVFPRSFSREEVSANDFLPHFSEIKAQDTRSILKKPRFDLLILVDGGNLGQFYDTSETLGRPPDLTIHPRRLHIDHHPKTAEKLGTHILHDTQVSSTTELVLNRLIPQDFINPQIATLGYAGLVGDTGNFRYNFYPSTLQLAALLLKRGAHHLQILDRLFFSHPQTYFDMLAYATKHTQYLSELGTSLLALPLPRLQKDQIDKFKLDQLQSAFKEGLARSIAGYPRGIILVEKKPGEIDVAARGNNLHNQLNLPQFFSSLGYQGGGHFNACGFRTQGDIRQVKKDILRALSQALNKQPVKEFSNSPQTHFPSLGHRPLIVYTDGASRGNPGPAAAAFVVRDPQGHLIHQAGKFLGRATNNVAEYTAVLLALQWLETSYSSSVSPAQSREKSKSPDQVRPSGSRPTPTADNPKTAQFYLDSQLIVRQLNGEYKIKSLRLKKLAVQIVDLIRQLQSRGVTVSFSHVYRSRNQAADALANRILDQRPA